MVLTLPDNGPRIGRAVATAAPGCPVVDCTGMDAAVAEGAAWARPDGVVLLSPAAPSFGRFKDYSDRAEAFRAAVRRGPAPVDRP